MSSHAEQADDSRSVSNDGPRLAEREIAKRRIKASREELEALIERTAMSPVIREKKDFFVAFFDNEGRLITGTNFPLGANAIEPILATFPHEELEPGDLFIYNDPYSSAGGVSHVPDMVVASPVFSGDDVVAFVEVFGHLWDVGGSVAGSVSPTAADIHSEGILVPPIRLRSGVDQFDDGLLRVLQANSRFPDFLVGDLRALTAAVDIGVARLGELVELVGQSSFQRIVDAIFEESRLAAVSEWESMDDGRVSFVELMEDNFGGGEEHRLQLTLAKKGSSISLDTSGTSSQAASPINFPMHPSVIGMMFGMYFLDPSNPIGLNAGFLETIERVDLVEGSLLAPLKPAPVGMRGITWIHTHSAVLGVLGQLLAGEVPAASATYVIYYLRDKAPLSEEPLFLMDGVGVGYGARPWSDGLDSIYYVAQKNLPSEFLESRWPVRIEHYGLHPDSGGPGRYRGGLGVIKRVEVLRDDLSLVCRMDNKVHPAWGAAGGKPGSSGCVIVNPGSPDERIIESVTEDVVLNKGDRFEIRTPGGGGWGHPFDRPVGEVVLDVTRGWVSIEKARADYGVSIRSDFSVDEEETSQLREQRK